ncbi:polyprenyl synthetase family protein [Streptomyces sp. DG2A-72]|uniref:polyprenyl synthetase family protein n=1 Tax=Streptomyces sp. DG2A-72 TaxID=3051386 RepID=UPI00265BBF0B|nr:polyprenyl synthetase family protein [Streptomyces sp. DG2A-72]MDO0936490.1 polyprenyl synthetase family protein [Streptomyces sp. DG2A-72]
MAEYHLAVGPSTPVGVGQGGKGVRAALVFVCARAVGGSEESVVAGAVAVELVHGFSLLHDDIMDGDRWRRHRTAAWVEFGVPAALLTGDALLVRAMRVVERTGSYKAVAVLAEALEGLMLGQSLDLDFERRDQVALEEYRDMAKGKTGALIRAACALGAVLSGAPASTVTALERFGQCAGIAYQCVDDVLGLWGDTQRMGKPVGGDIARGKKTYPLVAALSAGGSAARRVRDLYARSGPWLPDRVAELVRAVEEAGGRAAAEQEAAAQLEHALHHLDRARLPASVRAELAALADGMIHRHR